MNEQSSYARVRERLEDIVLQVRSKDVPLEKSLDLYEEAIRLGNTCADLIDKTDFSADEIDALLANESRIDGVVGAADDEQGVSDAHDAHESVED